MNGEIMENYLTPLFDILWWLFAAYVVILSVFMILENKSPQMTFAWILCFLFLPVVGVIIYLMFGRDYRAFSREDRLLRQNLRTNVGSTSYLAEVLACQEEAIEKLKQHGPPVYDRVVEMMRRNANAALLPYNSLEILQNGQEKYPRLLEDLRAAQHFIHMEYYEWASDDFMQEVKQILLERVKAGVQVRILYDPIGSFYMLQQQYVKEMNAGGARMLPWSPIYALHTISYRSHRKIVVVDGRIGYTGGLNMAETYLKGPEKGRFTGWRDTHCRVTGQIVWALQSSFAIQWYNTTQEQLTDPAYLPPLSEQPGYLPLQMVNSGPDAAWKAIRNMYFAMINGATHHIYVQSPFFILDEGLADAFAAAARSGIDVRVMLAPAGPDGAFAYRAGFTYSENMAAAGVKIYYYQGDYFHAKTINVDSAICSIGSANMDIRSFNINYESNLVIYDKNIAAELAQDFCNDLQKCQEFDLEAYQHSNRFGRGRDSLFRLASPLL
jgi:cardiolipin synthase